MNKYVIYTVIVGGYDEVRQPLVVDDRFDYVLFSDQYEDGRKVGVWNVKNIASFQASGRVLSRYPKCLPTRFLSEYEYSLYIDGTIQIASEKLYDRFLQLVDEKCKWGGISLL